MLIALLEREAALIKTMVETQGNMTEERSEYWASLTDAVGALHDPAAIDVLLSPAVLEYGTNNIVSIASFGEPIVSHVLSLYRSGLRARDRWYFSAIAKSMLEQHLISAPQDMSALRALFLAESASADWLSRDRAASALRWFNDPEVVHRLQSLARDDDYSTAPGGTLWYPVRAQAATALRQLDGAR